MNNLLMYEFPNYFNHIKNTFDDHNSCQTFQKFAEDGRNELDSKYLIDQVRNALSTKDDKSQSWQTMQMLHRVMQQQQINLNSIQEAILFDDESKKVVSAIPTDEESTQARIFKLVQYSDRQMRIQRYKNKRRNWSKQISYDCRKVVADQRLRIKGRFISKNDQKQISLLCPNEVFDDKKNLDIEKFNAYTNIFRYSTDPKAIPKRQILNIIRDEADFKLEQKRIVKRIKKKQMIFQILTKKR